MDYIDTVDSRIDEITDLILQGDIYSGDIRNEFRQIINNAPDKEEIKNYIVRKIYSTKLGFPSIQRIHQYSGIDKETIKRELSGIKAYSYHAPVPQQLYRTVKALYVDQIWAADLVEMVKRRKKNKSAEAFIEANDGYNYILNIIDVFSRYVWSTPLKTKDALTVSIKFETLAKKGLKPEFIWTDDGKEFKGEMIEFANQNDIKLYQTKTGRKSVIVERFNKTQKELLEKHIELHGNWINYLKDVTYIYNNRVHSFHGLTPAQARLPEYSTIVLSRFVDSRQVIKPLFDIDDRVRILLDKGTFTKGYTRRWSKKTYYITAIHKDRNVAYYELEDNQGYPAKRWYVVTELQRVK